MGPQTDITNLIVIGASAGGHAALIKVLTDIPADIPAAIVILMHLSSTTTYELGKSLARFTSLPIVVVESSQPLRDGVAFIPPPGWTAWIEGGMIRVELRQRPPGPPITINQLFASAANRYGRRAIGVVLTGLLRDGTDGLRAVHDAGGITIVQNPIEAEFADMPASAMKELPVTFCLNLAEIGPALELLARRDTGFETGVAVSVRTLKDRVALMVRLIEQSEGNLETRRFLKRELIALKRDVDSIQRLLRKVPPQG